MEILYECRDFAVVKKPAGIPSQPDGTGIPDLLTLLAEDYRKERKPYEVYPVHRLDLGVGGLLAVGRTKAGAALLSELIESRKMTKTYFAIVEGTLPSEGEYTDLLYKDTASAKAYVTEKKRPGAKPAHLSYRTLAYHEDRKLTLVAVTLDTGRFHQIRAQFSAHGNPIYGDRKYGSKTGGATALFCAELTFIYGGRPKSFVTKPDLGVLPWAIFSEEDYTHL